LHVLYLKKLVDGHSQSPCTLTFQAVRKLNDAKKLESSAHYSADFGKE
jgi:hypothetical protein